MRASQTWSAFGLVVLALCSWGLPGCGETRQVVLVEPTDVPKPIDNVRQSLKDVAKSGEFNSGTPLIKDELEKLRGNEGVNVDALKQDVDKLLQLTSRTQIQAKAKEIIAKLPVETAGRSDAKRQ